MDKQAVAEYLQVELDKLFPESLNRASVANILGPIIRFTHINASSTAQCSMLNAQCSMLVRDCLE